MIEVAIGLAVVISKAVERIRKSVVVDGWQVPALAVVLAIAAVFGGEGVLEQLGALNLDGIWEKLSLALFGGAGAGFVADFTGRSGPFFYDE